MNTPSDTDVVGLLSETLHGIRTAPACVPFLRQVQLSFLPANMGLHVTSTTDSLEVVRSSHPDRFRTVEDELLAMQDIEVKMDVMENYDVKVSAEAIRDRYIAPLFPRIWGQVRCHTACPLYPVS